MTAMAEQVPQREAPAADVPLLEREQEASLLADALATARAGAGALVLVEGEAGIGKTRLLQLARSQATEHRMTVLQARGAELERDFGWGVARQLFERWLLDRDVDERERILAGPAEPSLGALGIEQSSRDREAFAAVHGLYWLMVNAAERTPLALLIDDAQWADEASLGWLAYVAARLEPLPVAAVVAVRRPDPGADRDPLRRLWLEPLARGIRPSPLSLAATRELVDARPPLTSEPPLAAACHEASGGNPFLLRALLDDLSELATEARPDPEGVRLLRPDEITRSVLLRLGRLPAAARTMASAFAVLGRSATTARAGTLSRLAGDDAASAAAALVAAGILTDTAPPGFVHPVVHGVVLGDISAPVRADLHAQGAAVLRQSGGGLQELAAQLLQAEPAADAQVVETLCEAARAMLNEGAPQSAVALLERAVREPPSDEARSDVLRLLGRALLRARGAAGVERLRAALDAASAPGERVKIALELARALEGLSRNVEAVALYEEALAELAPDDELQRPSVEAGLTAAAAQQLSTLPRAIELLGLAFSGDHPALAAEPVMRAVAALALAAAGVPDAVAMAEAALEDPALLDTDTSIAVGLALSPLAWGDRLDQALAVWDELAARARTRGVAMRYAFVVTFRAEVHFRAGRLADAEADAREALAVSEEVWSAPPPVDIFAFLAEALIERGELEEAEQLLAVAGPAEELSDYQGNNPLLMARGRLRLAQGRAPEAAADLLELGRRCDAFTLRNPAAMPWRSHAALALHQQDPERALALADEELEIAQAFGAGRAIGIGMRACGLVRQGPEAIERLGRAVEILRASPARLELARALVDLGAAQRRAAERVTARQSLAEGLDLAAACGAVPLVERARAELTAAGARPRRDRITGRDALTASELRVATMATEGRTNREIAESLWVTLSTVEAHLTRVYRKLDITRRSDLPEALERAQVPA
jgi:DNA-binding CsgD family transcriptional regulator